MNHIYCRTIGLRLSSLFMGVLERRRGIARLLKCYFESHYALATGGILGRAALSIREDYRQLYFADLARPIIF